MAGEQQLGRGQLPRPGPLGALVQRVFGQEPSVPPSQRPPLFRSSLAEERPLCACVHACMHVCVCKSMGWVPGYVPKGLERQRTWHFMTEIQPGQNPRI